ncbi:MAG TPA: phosphoglucosamine mutase [Gemmatimonadales bacterium]|nr:phosphoglucosamine mutase [Gemmatimonadales bacterium]
MSDTLMVGVSGIRGIVGTDLTPEIVARYAAAFGTWAKTGKREERRGKGSAAVVLGRDARTSGLMFAHAALAGLVSVGCDVIDVGLVSTPTVQLAVEHHHAAGGIILTASHNPIEWNALKFVGPDGIFLDTADGTRVRALADGGGAEIARGDWSAVGRLREDEDAVERHLDAVLRLPAVNARAIRRRRFKVALDCVRGAGGTIMPELLERLGCRVSGMDLEPDGRFPRAPEPVPENLKKLSALVRRSKADIGIAVDPDVDRLAIVDERGRAIGEDYTLAFAVRAVLGQAVGRSGGRRTPASARPADRPSAVVCNLSTSLVVEDAARAYGADIVRARVGEAHVARKLLELGAKIGGEGNGGVMYPALHAGRDAPLAAALALTLLARESATVGELVAAAPRYVIVKGKVPRGAALDRVYAGLRARFADATVNVDDGLRLAWADRWLHVRASNTEPIIRLIAEAPSGAAAEGLVEEGRQICAAS